MIIKPADNIQYIKWPTERVLAFTTTRLPAKKSQLSKALKSSLVNINNTKPLSSEFSAFNLAEHVGDCALAVAKNRKSLLELLPKPTKIQWLDQVHGNKVVVVNVHDINPIIADAAITRSRNLALAIMTADCLPILLSNKEGGEVAAIHAGWRPLAANIIEKTVAAMHSPTNEIYAWLGPCIGAQAFEVGEEVKQAFCQSSLQFEGAFQLQPLRNGAKGEKKYLANLQLIAELSLLAVGVKNITTMAECTYANLDKYYSYRRDGKTGRMASIICIT